ncbi:MAG: Ig-like domain-containing protein, partial [Gemmatimonadales bacterium]|nr:Ig-like domain-containing protein [Gemmatimonadales bacterium]
LFPQQTQALTATTLDASGNTLTGRSVTWTTSALTVATVSATGLVTAAGVGSATITATSETRTGTAIITVTDPSQVTSAGGTVEAAGGAVKITVPAGAVGAPIVISATPNAAAPTGLPALTYGVVGTHYALGPAGTTFAAPVTVTLKYDPAKLPAWAIPGDLAIYHFTGGAWVKLPGLVVDPVANTITAQTTSFSPFTIGTRLPPAVLSPGTGSINFIQRSVTFAASIAGRTSTGLSYSWAGTNANGTLLPLGLGSSAQYTMTQPQLPPPNSDIDYVQVIVRGAIDPSQPNAIVPLASAVASINSNLTLTFSLNPDDSEPDFGASQTLDAAVKNADGSIYQAPQGLALLMVWKSSQFHGDLDIHSPNHQTDVKRGTYKAKNAQQSAQVPPRIDEVTVEFYQSYVKNFTTIKTLATGLTEVTVDSSKTMHDRLTGTANAFLEVAPRTALATFQVRTTPTPAGFCKTADAIIPKVSGATSYELTVTGIVGSPFGPTITRTVTGATSTGSVMDVYDTGNFLGVPLDGGCGGAQSSAAREAAYNSQYGNATFTVKTSP